MFCLNKNKQLNFFEQVSDLKAFASKQPVGFITLLCKRKKLSTQIIFPPIDKIKKKDY